MNEMNQSKQSLKRIKKKEKKIISSIIRQYFHDEIGLMNSDDECDDNQNLTLLLIDNRNDQIRLNAFDLLRLIQNKLNIQNDQNIFEDYFLMLNKKFLLLKVINEKICHQIYSLNYDEKFKDFGVYFIIVQDLLLNLAIKKYQSSIDDIIKPFLNTKQPNGLQILPNFIDSRQRLDLLNFARKYFEISETDSKIFQSYKFQTVHFGFVFDEQNSIVHESKKILCSNIPEELDFVLNDKFAPYITEKANQLTIYYFNGQNGDHFQFNCDANSEFTEWAMMLHIGSDVAISWRNPNDDEKNASTILSSGSLMIIKNDTSYEWNQCIEKTVTDIIPLKYNFCTKRNRILLQPKSENYLFTFRKTRPFSLQCDFDKCVIEPKNNNPMTNNKKSSPHEIEIDFVHSTYDQIADHFSTTRYKCWPQVEQFIQSLQSGALVLDVGCGNGRFLSVNPSIVTIGTDRSINLLKICHQRNYETFLDDCLHIDKTLRREIFDAIICIAVIHHMATEERRIRAIHSILNLLSIDGVALIYVWAFEQKRGASSSKYLKTSATKAKVDNDKKSIFPIHENRKEFIEQDVLVPWNKKLNNDKHFQEKFLRFYHVFHEGELENLIDSIAKKETNYLVKIEKSYYDDGNWCVIVRKLTKNFEK